MQHPNHLVLIRHGERLDDKDTVTDLERSTTPFIYDIDTPLSLNGKQQALTTGHTLANLLNIGEKTSVKLYSSPYLRCVQTSERVLKGLSKDNQEIHVREELSEYQSGEHSLRAKIEHLVINRYGEAKREDFLREYARPDAVINYPRDYTTSF